MVLDPTLDLTPVVGNEGFQQLPDYLDITPTQSAPAADTGSEIAPPPQKQADTDWADISTKVFTAMREEVPAVPTSSSFFERFEGVTDIVGKPLEWLEAPIGKLMDAANYPADRLEQLSGLLYWHELDLGTRWELGNLTYESIGVGDKDEIIRRIQAGEDTEAVIKDYEGGWADMLAKLVLDPLNLFGVPGLGLAAKALPGESTFAKVLMKANSGFGSDIANAVTGGRLGIGVTKEDQLASNIEKALDASVRRDKSAEEVRKMGEAWFKKPDWNLSPKTWLRNAKSLTTEAKRDELRQAFTANTFLMGMDAKSHPEVRKYMQEMFDGITNGDLVQHYPGYGIATGPRMDEPPAILGIDAVGKWAGITGAEIDNLPSMRKGWFRGTPAEWELLPDAEKEFLFPNREQWQAVFQDDIHKLVGGEKPGAIDVYAGLADFSEDLSKVEAIPGNHYIEELNRMHGIVKSGMSVLWLNTPRYVVSNMVSNTIRGLTAIGSGHWRRSSDWEDFIGKSMIDLVSADPSRIHEVSLATNALAGKRRVRDIMLRPFVYAGSNGWFFGDNNMRKRITSVGSKRMADMLWETSDRSTRGILRPIDWGDIAPEAQKAVTAKLIDIGLMKPQEFLADLRNGKLGGSQGHILMEAALDSMGVQGGARKLFYDQVGNDFLAAVTKAANESTNINDFTTKFEKAVKPEHDFMMKFEGFNPLTQKGNRPVPLVERRSIEEAVVIKGNMERTALAKRVVEMRGGNGSYAQKIMEDLAREEQKRLNAMFEKIDFDAPFGLDGAEKLRGEAMREFEKWQDTAWTSATKKLTDYYGESDSELGSFFKRMNGDRVESIKAHRTYRNEIYKKKIYNKDVLPGGPHDLGAQDWFDAIDAHRAKTWDEHLARIGEPYGIQRLEQAERLGDDYASVYGDGFIKMRESFSHLVGEMKKAAPSLFTEGGLKKGHILTPEQSARLLEQFSDLEENANLVKYLSLKSGAMLADHAILNYGRRYGVDEMVKYVFPYHFWPSRMAHRFARAALTRPGAAGAFAVLINGQYELTKDLPERFKGKVGIPVPFLPDWMGDKLYFDPIKQLFPFSQGIDPGIGDEETTLGKIDAWMSSVGAGAAPWFTMPLQMVGAFGERDKWIRYQMQGGPFITPGTAAQQAISNFLGGQPPETYEGELTPDDLNNLTLGNALPEPRLREILGIPPGDQWDAYRVLRMVANMAGDGTITADEGLRAMKERSGHTWEVAKKRASDEAGLRNLSGWIAGVNFTVYPKGEEIQNGLDAIFRVAREADRKGASDGNIATFFDAFPEFQVRQVQKAWYRGQPEMDSELDTNLYYIDLNKVRDELDPEIAYYEKLKEATPKGQRKDVSNILESLYGQKRQAIRNLKIKYAKRKTTPSVYANPYDRAMAILREQYFGIDGNTIQEIQGGQLLFIKKLAGKGMADSYYDFGKQADSIIEEYDAKIAAASKTEKDDLYRARSQAIESLTSKALVNVSAQDFMAYLEKRKREPSDEEAKRQQASDALRTFFHAPQEARSAVFMKYPTLATVYGQNPTEELAGALDAWWANYDRLTPNSVARDDYVQSTAGKLNAIREALGMKPMQPRQRASAAPFTANVDPYIMSLVEAGMPEEKKSLVKTVERDNEGLITKITESYE